MHASEGWFLSAFGKWKKKDPKLNIAWFNLCNIRKLLEEKQISGCLGFEGRCNIQDDLFFLKLVADTRLYSLINILRTIYHKSKFYWYNFQKISQDIEEV
jgi:hypothetical protein